MLSNESDYRLSTIFQVLPVRHLIKKHSPLIPLVISGANKYCTSPGNGEGATCAHLLIIKKQQWQLAPLNSSPLGMGCSASNRFPLHSSSSSSSTTNYRLWPIQVRGICLRACAVVDYRVTMLVRDYFLWTLFWMFCRAAKLLFQFSQQLPKLNGAGNITLKRLPTKSSAKPPITL